MRLQHLKQIASALPADDAARAEAKAVIVAEVEQLHWRIWSGKARDAQISIDRVRAVMQHFQGEPDGRKSIAPSRKLWTARRGADLLLQVRCAVYNGTLGSGFGQKFQPANDACPPMAVAA